MPLPWTTAPPDGAAGITPAPGPCWPSGTRSRPTSLMPWAARKFTASKTNRKTNASLTFLEGDVIVETSFYREFAYTCREEVNRGSRITVCIKRARNTPQNGFRAFRNQSCRFKEHSLQLLWKKKSVFSG